MPEFAYAKTISSISFNGSDLLKEKVCSDTSMVYFTQGSMTPFPGGVLKLNG